MKTYINKIIGILNLVTILLLASCSKFLDVVPAELVTEDKIWTDINSANTVLAHLYTRLPNELHENGNTISETSPASDESYHHWYAGSPSEKYNLGAWNAADNPFGEWESRYQDIRKANIFLEKIESVPIPPDQSQQYTARIPHYIAEARFLRAIYHFELFKRYGAIPIITQSIEYSDKSTWNVARNSVEEVVDFIVSECEDIAPKLLLKHPDGDLGRINRGAALALSAKTLLYAASPLFNGNAMYANVKNKDGKLLFPQSYDREKWKRAADAAKKVLDLDYKLYKPLTNDPINGYAKLFYSRDWEEVILPYNLPNTKFIEQNHLPYGGSFLGWSKFSPTQELIDSYETKTGYPINHPNSGYKEDGTVSEWIWAIDGTTNWVWMTDMSNMYKDRDPRFYASIGFHNSFWVQSRNTRAIKLAWWGNGKAYGSNGWPMQGGGTTSITGYTIKKWCDPTVDIQNWYTSPDAKRNYPIFRLAEFYLAYAEALNEYHDGPNADAFSAINAVRKRVDMPDLPVIPEDNIKDGFRKRVQNEKRVEFAFEGHRFWDVRRWMLGTQYFNGSVHGLNARPTASELSATGLDVNGEEAGAAVFYKRVAFQKRVFLDRHYLMPIPISEMDKNIELVQNFGW
ncbi:RagB/SusD family nutrient uptake outer membrane protein [Sphingobacterium tabacisoli]|uniref:RagB/SusD family nutrient uptake outer membrane protein n=1 Tax=Sphingobacterium tabacisoli TaxID=2044855 RepID=A0ABW5L640_9SPHI|nr:RagB/SusD family nutrient uptake outer membrane protein [Sphingobacterium tabacisoli]